VVLPIATHNMSQGTCSRSRTAAGSVAVFQNRRELVARAEIMLRRQETFPPTIEIGALYICPSQGSARWKGRPLCLSAKEFDILATLALHQGRVLSRDDLLNCVWSEEFIGEARLIDHHIRMLRHKLADGAALIETVRCAGYRLVCPVESPAD